MSLISKSATAVLKGSVQLFAGDTLAGWSRLREVRVDTPYLLPLRIQA